MAQDIVTCVNNRKWFSQNYYIIAYLMKIWKFQYQERDMIANNISLIRAHLTFFPLYSRNWAHAFHTERACFQWRTHAKEEWKKNCIAPLTKAHTMRRSRGGIEEHMLLCLIHKSMTIKPQTNNRDNRCSLARQRREKGAGIGGDYLHNKLLFYLWFMN